MPLVTSFYAADRQNLSSKKDYLYQSAYLFNEINQLNVSKQRHQ